MTILFFYFTKLLFSDAKKKAVTPTSGPAKIVIPAQAGIGTLNRAQRAPIKYL